jgi:hypothetical protein
LLSLALRMCSGALVAASPERYGGYRTQKGLA